MMEVMVMRTDLLDRIKQLESDLAKSEARVNFFLGNNGYVERGTEIDDSDECLVVYYYFVDPSTELGSGTTKLKAIDDAIARSGK